MINSMQEWLNLPKIVCSPLQTAEDKGTIYTVRKVGFAAIPATDKGVCEFSDAKLEDGKYFFPIVEIEFNKKAMLYRLPIELTEWAINSVAMAQYLGRSPFPMQVEFGILNGKHYAEMVI